MLHVSPASLAPAVRLASSPLARACDWAVKRINWVNATSTAEKWKDERVNLECGHCDAIIERAITVPSTSVADIMAKARLALNQFTGHQLEDEGLPHRLAVTVLREIEALSRDVTGDPVATALIEAIECEWAAQIGPAEADLQDMSRQAEARGDERWDRRAALSKAAAELPATSRGARHAKALALAWIDWSETQTIGAGRDAYATDGKLGFDIEASLRATVEA